VVVPRRRRTLPAWPVAVAMVLLPAAARLAPCAGDDLRFWLENMAWYHRYTLEEMAAATGLPADEVRRCLAEYDIRPSNRPPLPQGQLLVLPYPGGRHPRIGFQEGAVDPLRGTKASVFLPWAEGGYAVVDCPEALWEDGKLVYLAHTHIPTVWDRLGVRLERVDWTRLPGGALESRRVLPDGVEYTARVLPRREAVDLELRLCNGSQRRLVGLRAQICVMLKGAPEFNAQTSGNKLLLEKEGVVAVRSADRKRWIVTVWDRGRAWENPLVPCIHSDPVLPDLEPDGEAVARGRLFVYEGEDVEAEIARREASGTLRW
jgi:hypothetical protein